MSKEIVTYMGGKEIKRGVTQTQFPTVRTEDVFELGSLNLPPGCHQQTAQPGKVAPKPSNPWIDSSDLRLTYSLEEEGNSYDTYQWRDTTMFVKIDPLTNEIMDIWEE